MHTVDPKVFGLVGHTLKGKQKNRLLNIKPTHLQANYFLDLSNDDLLDLTSILCGIYTAFILFKTYLWKNI